MMRVVKWVLLLAVLLPAAAFLHYVLPRHSIVYVTSTQNLIVSPEEFRGFRAFREAARAAGPQGQMVADVFFINTIRANRAPLVLRNEDTGFGMPPYFKFNAADLQAYAQSYVSTEAAPRWVAVRYYGWRSQFLSMFPNAVAMWEVPGPDTRIIPWFNIVFLSVLGALVWAVWSRLRRWRRRRADPVAASWEAPAPRRGWFG